MSDYQIAPTDSLRGIHMRGTVRRRFLISYPVPPQSLSAWIPPGAELCVRHGLAWVSVCFVEMEDMRPSFLPGVFGMRSRYLIHRTRARLPFPDGSRRESVLVLEANINRRLLGRLGRLSTGVCFRGRDIEFREEADVWRLRMTDGGHLLYDAEIPRRSIADALPASSSFTSVAEAEHFLFDVSFGGEWHRDLGRVRLLAETHDAWRVTAGTCRTRRNGFLEALGHGGLEADHVFTMTDVPHHFALRGFDVNCAGMECPSVDSIEETVGAVEREGKADTVAAAQLGGRL
jgi:uncharacterized protein YqjF (DUF2071 family)